jgi:hypothetical protein
MSDRNWVKWDRYALFDLSRDKRLKPAEFVVLYTLAVLADFRSQDWTGTIVELSQYTPCSRTTVAAAVQRLVELNLISVVTPFRQHSAAKIHIDSYWILVLPTARRAGAKAQDVTYGSVDRPEIAIEKARDGSNIASSETYHQGKQPIGRDRGNGEVRGLLQQHVGIGPRCPDCGKPTFGAPLGSNCQCPF